MDNFRELDANTIKAVRHSRRSRLCDFTSREIIALFCDESISRIAHALAIEPNAVYYDSHFCRDSAALLDDAIYRLDEKYRSLMTQRGIMDDNVFKAHREIFRRLKRQLEKRYRHAEKLAVLEWKAEEESQHGVPHEQFGKYRDFG